MPNFDLLAHGAVTRVWRDPPFGETPPRLNAYPHRLPRYWAAQPGHTLQLYAAVGGIVGPLDNALGGMLFKWWWLDVPDDGLVKPALDQAAGRTSVVDITLPPAGPAGHYTVVCWRDKGGSVLWPFELEDV